MESPCSPEVCVVVPVGDGDAVHVPALLECLRAQRDVRAEIVLVDGSTRGDLDGVELAGALVVRADTPSRGAAYRLGLVASLAPFVAWQDPRVRPTVDRLARQLAHIGGGESIDLVTAEIWTSGEGEALLERVDRDPAADAPGAFWHSAVVVRREALTAVDETCFAPAELALFQRLRAAGRTAHLAEAVGAVAPALVPAAEERVHQDAELLALADAPRTGPPEVTVLLATHDRCDVLMECLEGFSRQLVPPGTLEIVVCDDGSTDGTADWAAGLELPVPCTFLTQANAGACAARNRALPHVHGLLVLFVNDDTIPFPDTVGGHLAAHRELAGQRAVVLGTFEQPPEEQEKALVRLVEGSHYVFGYAGFEPGQVLDGVHFYTCNVSVPAEAVRLLGEFDESFPCFGEDTDYGVRLEDAGWRIHYRPEIRSIHRHVQGYELLRWRQPVAAKAYTRLLHKHPRLVDDMWAMVTTRGLDEKLAPVGPFIPTIEAAARGLADVRLASLERLGGELAGTAERIASRLAEIVEKLNGYWWSRGTLERLEELGSSGFAELLAGEPVPHPEVRETYELLRCDGGATPLWAAAAERWLAPSHASEGGTGPSLFLWIASEDAGGGSDCPDPARAGATAAALMRRARSDRRIAVLAEPLDEETRLQIFAGAKAWIPTGSEGDADDARVAAVACTVARELPADAAGVPWPLATAQPVRWLAWPRWDSAAELERLAALLAPAAGRDDLCLVLRHDPEVDADLRVGAAALERALDGIALEVLLEAAPADERFGARLSLAVDAALCLADADEASPRAALLAELSVPVLADLEAVRAWLARADASPIPDVSLRELQEPTHA